MEALSGLVALDVQEKRPSDARARVDAALAAAPGDPALLTLAGRTFVVTGDDASGEAMFRKAIERSPDALGAYSQLGEMYLRQGRLDQARQEFASVSAREARPVAALTMIGMIQQMQGDMAAARASYERALQFDPRAAVAATNLAWISAESGQNLDVALQLAQTAKSQLPDHADIEDTLGWVYYRKGLYSLAVKSFQHSVELAPSGAVYHYPLGLAYEKGGDQVNAAKAFETAKRLNPALEPPAAGVVGAKAGAEL
jgi:Flp pilus assembly protein TadD